MKQLTICTNRHNQELRKFTLASAAAGEIIVRRAGWISGNMYGIICTYIHTIPCLYDLLAKIAIQDNPVYKYSRKLADMARNLRGTALYAEGQKELTYFLQQNDTLHLEGYVTFRMSNFREKLDLMSYSLIKKLKLVQND